MTSAGGCGKTLVLSQPLFGHFQNLCGVIMHIRKMNDGEFPIIIRLINETVHSVCVGDYTKKELDAWAPNAFDTARFIKALTPCHNLVCVENSKIVGFISVEKNGFINRLFTHKDYLRRGIATSLLKEAEIWAISRGLKKLTLDSSKTAVDFYLKNGFKKTGISVIEKDGVVFRNTVMKKDLGGDLLGKNE